MNRLLKSEMTKLTRARSLHLIALLMLALSVVTSLSCLSYVNSPKAEELEIVFHGYDAFFSSLKDTPTISVWRRWPYPSSSAATLRTARPS